MIVWNEALAYELCLVTHPSWATITVAAICIFPVQVAITKHRFVFCFILYYADEIIFLWFAYERFFLFIDTVLRTD